MKQSSAGVKTSAVAVIQEAMKRTREVAARDALWVRLLPDLRLLQSQGASYRDLAQVATKAGCPVSATTVFRRLKKRSRGKKKRSVS